ncbi:MAG: isoleucine--tRNA ligase [Dehalococcoidia bacterium]|nr:isoleucine--tRNA ligase [Dehalococcoidia bacterium]
MFQTVNTKISFPELEERILRFWKERDIFTKTIESRRQAPLFVFYEGPPTANGRPGIHHVLSRIYKDIILRYRTMRGYLVPRKAGWDTHGLPVELEIEKMLGFTGKQQIEEYGVARFNALCRESVFSYLKDWERLTERIAFWLDMENPYITMDNDYIESLWWAIRQLWDKGLIYQGYKVTPPCPRCGTSLSSHEVALGYRDDAVDPSVFIKFKVSPESKKGPGNLPDTLVSDIPTYFLAWTTTPWTLPGNTALAVSPQAEYSIIEQTTGTGRERLVLASARLSYSIRGDYETVGRISGSELIGCHYEPLFRPGDFNIPVQQFDREGNTGGRTALKPAYEPARAGRPAFGTPPQSYRVIGGDFVSMEDGTGIVHIAPAFGEVDFTAGEVEGLYFVQPVDLAGTITGSYPFAGKFVKKADPEIIEILARRGLLYRSEHITHTYPFCWRCDTPLLYYAKQSWYIRTTAFKDKLIAGNEEINWYPEHIKYGRFGDWLKNNVDWAFSRERYWGTPLPIWQCESCGHSECIGGIDDIRRLADREATASSGHTLEDCLTDLHRPLVDAIVLKCGRCGHQMRRRQEVIDCWFDSGAMPFAQWHYPYANKTEFEKQSQADFISEAIDQTRGWFYSLHALSTLLFERPAFKNVICLGHILDAHGEKMSKTRGNVVDPWSILDTSGCDALRWYMFTSAPAGNVRRFSAEMVQETLRSFLLTLWNTYSFFVTYANIDRYQPESASPTPGTGLDVWIISELNQLIHDVTRHLEEYDPTTAARRIETFVDDLSNWYVRRSRRRFWKSENDTDKQAAHSTLYRCLVTLSQLLAPFTPFIAEEIYQNLVRSIDPRAPESVHLTDFPTADVSCIDQRLAADIRLAIRICRLGRAARAKAQVKVRQPLPGIVVKVRNQQEAEAVRKLADQIREELNVKELVIDDRPEEAIIASAGKAVTEREGDLLVVLHTELSPQLQAEGAAREVVRRVQMMRRQANYEITDHIIVYYQGDAAFSAVMNDFATYIKQETLAVQLVEGSPSDVDLKQAHKIAGREVTLGIKRTG